MYKYYRRRKYYNQSWEIKIFKDLFSRLLQAWIAIPLLLILQYAIPVYFYIKQNPIWLIPVWIIVLSVILGFYYIKKRIEKKKYMAIQKFNEILKLDWREFEKFVAAILEDKGFHTILWVWIRDGWVDVTAHLWDKKFLVQCKHYGFDNVWVEKIRELNGIMHGEVIPAGWIFVTTSGFTPDAISEANKYGIDLWDRNYLIEYLKSKAVI